MTHFLHAIKNESPQQAHTIVLDPGVPRPKDVIVGPGLAFDYDSILGSGVQVPEANTAIEFLSERVIVDVGQTRWSLFVYGSMVRIVQGDAFSTTAPALGGFGDSGAFGISIQADGTLSGYVYRFIQRPYLSSTSWAPVQYGLHGIGSGGALLQKAYVSNRWTPWASLGRPIAELTGPVASISWVLDRYSIYALGADGAMYEKFYASTAWEDWIQHLPPTGVTLVDLSAVYWITDRWGIYAVGSDGHLHQKWYATDHWSAWENLDRPTTAALIGPVTSVSWSSSRYGVYALGDDGNVWQKWWAVSWSGWETIAKPPVPLQSLASVSWADRQYSVIGIGVDGKLWEIKYKYGWGAWANLGPAGDTLAGPVTGVCWNWPGISSAYFAIATDGSMRELFLDKWTIVDGS